MKICLTESGKGGVVVTSVRYGAYKAEGSEYESLSEGALARIKVDIDQMGALFCETVARNRGLKTSVVKGFEARTFMGASGVSAGLADQVCAPDAAFANLIRSL